VEKVGGDSYSQYKKRNLTKTDFVFLSIAFGDTLIAALAGER
jgi:hypothetical protein